MDIRHARPEDVVSLLETMRLAFCEVGSEFSIPPPDLPYAMQAMLDQIAQGLVHVALDGGRVVGVIALGINRWPWTAPTNIAGRYLFNEYFWVERAHRHHGTSRKLLDAAKGTADTLGLPLMIEMASGGVDAPLKDKFVKGQGFVYAGGKFFRAPRAISGT